MAEAEAVRVTLVPRIQVSPILEHSQPELLPLQARLGHTTLRPETVHTSVLEDTREITVPPLRYLLILPHLPPPRTLPECNSPTLESPSLSRVQESEPVPLPMLVVIHPISSSGRLDIILKSGLPVMSERPQQERESSQQPVMLDVLLQLSQVLSLVLSPTSEDTSNGGIMEISSMEHGQPPDNQLVLLV